MTGSTLCPSNTDLYETVPQAQTTASALGELPPCCEEGAELHHGHHPKSKALTTEHSLTGVLLWFESRA